MAGIVADKRMGMAPAGGARLRACGRAGADLVWRPADADATKAIASFGGDVPATASHRHRRPLGTS